MNNLRWLVKQDGTRVLQQHVARTEVGNAFYGYEDIPSIPEVKEEVKPREFWIASPYSKYEYFESNISTRSTCDIEDSDFCDAIHVVELPNGSRVLSRREVIHAIEAVINLSQHQVDLISNNLGFEVYK